METVHPQIQEIAALFANHRVVPFLGAGCSLGHLRMDWDGLRDEMAGAVKTKERNHLKVASAYVKRLGRARLSQLLEARLRVPEFDLNRGEMQLRLMGLNVPVLYTTNQDRLLELCYAQHGRPLGVVIDIEDIASMNPRDPVLYKFHGDFGRPESIVFCEEDYVVRGPASEHPLDIRLRSDALARTFVFIGYSFRDPNVRALFADLQRLFGGKLPPSFLIQHTPDDTFASELTRDFGVRVINCRETNPAAATDDEAFSAFMRHLCHDVIGKKTGAALEERFKPRVPASSWVATRFEVDSVGQAVMGLGLEEGLRAFRSAYDLAVIPNGFSEAVADQFVDLCKKAVDDRHATELRGALFTLRCNDPGSALKALSASYAVSNVLPSRGGGMEMFMPHAHGLPDDGVVRVVAVASAFLLLQEWGRAPSKRFYEWVAFMLHSAPSRAQIPSDVGPQLEAVFAAYYTPAQTTFENPLARANRLQGHGVATAPGFDHIYRSLVAMWPKASPRPYQT